MPAEAPCQLTQPAHAAAVQSPAPLRCLAEEFCLLPAEQGSRWMPAVLWLIVLRLQTLLEQCCGRLSGELWQPARAAHPRCRPAARLIWAACALVAAHRPWLQCQRGVLLRLHALG